MQGYIPPEAFVDQLVQQAMASGDVRVANQQAVPEIAHYIARLESPLLFKQNQSVYAYAIHVDDASTGEKSAAILTVHHIPNNGAPATSMNVFGVSKPRSGEPGFDGLNHDLMAFVHSYRYDNRWVQAANANHAQFLSRQQTRNRSFQSRQNQIHQNNMEALDSSFNSYMNRSDSSSRGQQAYVDSVLERQQYIDRSTGQRYEADGYYEHNYVNPHDPGLSARTNDPNWNPNVNTNPGWDYNPLDSYDYR